MIRESLNRHIEESQKIELVCSKGFGSPERRKRTSERKKGEGQDFFGYVIASWAGVRSLRMIGTATERRGYSEGRWERRRM